MTFSPQKARSNENVPWLRALLIGFVWGLILVSRSAAADRSAEQTSSNVTDRPTTPPLVGPPAHLKAKSSRTAGPRVLSKAEADRRRARSSFLHAPDSPPSTPYGDDESWQDIPAWRQTSFFGIRARGQFFIYVLDGSGSMIDDDRFPRATIELRRSVFALQPPQRFEVIFYNDESIPMPGGAIPRSADIKSKNALLHWLRLIEPEGGTVPLPALSQAIALRPDAIFFLSDGVLPEGTVEAIAKSNRTRVPIHCIDLAGGLAGDQLRRIAEQNGGRYASRPGTLHASP